MPKKAASKKKKKAEKSASPTIPEAPPAAVQLPLVGEKKPVWRESTDSRLLKVPFTPKEHESNVGELARSVNGLTVLDNEKKATMQSFGHRRKTLEARQGELSGYITNGFQLRQVNCKWHFESTGPDPDNAGQMIYNPEYKVLVRTDTGEVVQTARLTQEDYETYQELPLDTDKPAPAVGGTPELPKTPEPPDTGADEGRIETGEDQD